MIRIARSVQAMFPETKCPEREPKGTILDRRGYLKSHSPAFGRGIERKPDLAEAGYFLAKAAFTSGLSKITSAKIPAGNPTRQHGDTQGTMEIAAAIMAML
jgi:hypothetical protein